MTDTLALSSGDYAAQILPHVGGGLGRLQWRGNDLVQVYPDTPSAADPERLGCFPMVPFAGRIRDENFAWRGKSYASRPHPSAPHSLHGDGWISPWQVEEASASSARLSLSCAQSPCAFAAQMDYELSAKGLTITTSVTNLSEVPFPFGLGQHPWFPREDGAQVQFGAERFWMEAPGGFPSQSISLPEELDHAADRDMPLSWRNNCYEGWDGSVRITYPKRAFATMLTAEKPLDWLMVYANPELPYVCFEPQSHLPAAHNMPGEGERFGLIELAPGEQISAAMTISAAAL